MKNKKIIALAMAVIMLAGCSGKKKADTSKAKDTQAKTAQTETANQEEKKEETTAPQTNSGTSEKKPSTASSSSSGKKASTPAKTSTPAKKPSTSSNKPASKPSKPSKLATHTVTCVVWLKDDQTGKEYIIHKETATYTGDDDFAARNKAFRAAATWGHNHADEYIEKYNIGSGNWGTRFQ